MFAGVYLALILFAFPAEKIVLPVPHLCEFGREIGVLRGALTCGPCSLEMCMAYLQHRSPDFENVKRFNALLEPTKANDPYFLSHGRVTSYQELIEIGEKLYGIRGLHQVPFSWKAVLVELRKKAPVIVCLKYGLLPEREDKGWTGGHFLVVVGVEDSWVICQDPDTRQPNKRYAFNNFLRAARGWSMIIGFEPLKLISVKRQGFKGEAKFNFPLKHCSFSRARIKEKSLFVDLGWKELRVLAKVTSTDNRIWCGKLRFPAYPLTPEERQKPKVILKHRYFTGRFLLGGMLFLSPELQFDMWIIQQRGNRILYCRRILGVSDSVWPLTPSIKGWSSLQLEDGVITAPSGEKWNWLRKLNACNLNEWGK